jgi:hypothetical protein
MNNLWAWLCARAQSFSAVAKSALTGPDNQSWAPGRIMGFGLFAVAVCAYVRITAAMLPRLVTAEQCGVYFQGSVFYFGGVGTVCIALVLGMAPSDRGGRWWGKDASPPPAP